MKSAGILLKGSSGKFHLGFLGRVFYVAAF